VNKIFETYDVVILGGGASGIAAAVAAAQNGAKTALVERASYLGGKATAAYVGTICGAYFRSENQSPKFVVGGFLKTFVTDLQVASESEPVKNKEGLQFLPYQKSAFKLLADQLIQDNKIDLFLHSNVYFAERQENKITKIVFTNYDKILELKANTFIDCTGDAILIDLLKLDHIRSDSYQTSTQVFCLNGLEGESIDTFKMSMIRTLQKGMQNDGLTKAARRLSIMPGSSDLGQLHFKLSIPFEITDKTNQMTALALYARALVQEIFDYLKKENKNFAKAKISHIEDEVGIRTGKRHLGKKVLTKTEVLGAKKHADSIARGAWPIEYWSMDSKPRMEYFDFEDYYDIPVGCLCSAKLDNLYFAGRNLSADDDAIASARVIGTCLQTGFAAGILASDIINGMSESHSKLTVQKKLEF